MVSVIIVSYNVKVFLKSCLESVFAQDYKNIEVIVVDNASQDTSLEFIRENYPAVSLIKNDKNEGACYARNRGIAAAKGRYILTLDCDVVLEKGFLERIVQCLEVSEDRTAMVQPKILKANKKTIFSTGIYLSPIRRFYDIGQGQTDSARFSRRRYVFGACSAAALYKKEMLEDIRDKNGYFDERFFFLAEDVDLAWRAHRKGWKAIYLPDAVCYHAGNSSKSAEDFRKYLCFRNRYLMMLKNDGIFGILPRFPLLLFYDLPRILYLLATNRYLWKKG